MPKLKYSKEAFLAMYEALNALVAVLRLYGSESPLAEVAMAKQAIAIAKGEFQIKDMEAPEPPAMNLYQRSRR